MVDFAWLMLVFPLLGMLINAFFGRRIGKRAVSVVACAAVGLAFLVALGVLFGVAGTDGIEQRLFAWITAGRFQVDFSLLLDPLSALMAAVVTGVSFLIHIYSIGYMAEDERYARYFTFMNLFVFAMLILVLANNYVMMYVGWEGVGLCSYLLIGFWFERKSAADAGKKAFIVNRVGDFGFALGIMLIFSLFGTVQFSEVFGRAPGVLGPAAATAVTLLLFVGAAGKSAQLPLYVWLPDAMEGPTPVSALIHAATMVTAGVYMVARNHVLYDMSPTAMTVVAVIGAATAFFAATMALVEKDLKRILAYSTISQLGYMFMAVGVGAYAAGMFHLTTHAFFKALLFLAAGSVMHALAGELNIFKMGDLKSKLPTTHAVFAVGAAALAGVPLFSGFFSKDEILWRAFQHSPILWLVGLVTALLTAVYIFRAFFVAFWGKSRLDAKVAAHVHESPAVMTVPMIILAVLAVAGGYIGIPHLSVIEGYLEPVLGTAHAAAAGGTEWILMAVSSLIALGGIALAWYLYVARVDVPARLSRQFAPLYTLLSRKYYVDEFYMAAIVEPLRRLGSFIADLFDPRVVDGAVNGTAWAAGEAGKGLAGVQNGMVRVYALSIFIGVVLLLGYFVLL